MKKQLYCNIVIVSLLLFSFFICIIGCGGCGGDSGGTTTNTIITPNPILNPTVTTAVIGSQGGTMEVKDPNNPLYGVKVEIPQGALSQITNITIAEVASNPSLPSGNYQKTGKIIDLQPNGLKFNFPAYITMPFDKSINLNDVVILSYDPVSDKWNIPTILYGDQQNNSIKIINSHFSFVIGYLCPSLTKSMNTGFIMKNDPNIPISSGQDSACLLNNDPLFFNTDPTYGGACWGFSIYARWHFINKSKHVHFFDVYDKQTAKSVISEAHEKCKESLFKFLTTIISSHPLVNIPHFLDGSVARSLYIGLDLFKKPCMVNLSSSLNKAHSVLVYAWDPSKSDFIIYDSNFSNPRRIHFDPILNLLSDPDYIGQTVGQTIRPNFDRFSFIDMENIAGYHDSDMEDIFNKYYKVPVTFPINPPSTQEKIYFVRSNDIYTINPDGTNETRLTNSGKFVSPVLSPDGKKIVFVSDPQEGINGIQFGKLGIADSDGSNVKIISNYDYNNLSGAEWFPDSQAFINRCDISIIDLNGTKVKDIPISAFGLPSMRISPDGTKIVYASAGQNNTVVLVSSINGTNTQSLLTYTFGPSETDFLANAWAPNGKELAVSMNDSTKGPMLWYVNLENNTKKLLVNKAYVNTWTRDGKKIIYGGNRIINSDGTGDTQLVSGYYSCLSPDGKNMIYSSNGDMWVYNFDTQKSQKLTSSASSLGWITQGALVVVNGQKISE
jgi:TolB protein